MAEHGAPTGIEAIHVGYTGKDRGPVTPNMAVLQRSNQIERCYSIQAAITAHTPDIVRAKFVATKPIQQDCREYVGELPDHVEVSALAYLSPCGQLFRIVHGNLVASMLSEHRDMDAAKRFFTHAKDVVGHKPVRVTTDAHISYPRAIRRVLGRKVLHRTNKYLNNRLKQDHRGIKQRYYPMRGLGSFDAASRFCSAFDEQRDYFRWRSKPKEKVPSREQRRMFRQRFGALQSVLMAA
ncbi:MAG: transposase [Chloroflexota bacterium]|nr:transposase [Chloroflexota bacterium]